MEKNLVGYRFSPTKEELINYYLKNKILQGETWLVDKAINEIDIYAYDPEFLPSLSKLVSNDIEWYFFCRREYYAPAKKKGTKRTTPSGFWKVTGKDREIKDKRGHGEVIGIKKPLVFLKGRSANGVKTPWVMHEYHITSLPPNQINYVICKVKYKGVDGDSLYGNNSNELNHSTMVSVSNTARPINTTPEVEQPREEDLYMYVEDPIQFNTDTFLNDIYPHERPQIPWDDEYLREFLPFSDGNFNNILGDLDLGSIMMDKTHRSDHRPKKALTGIIVGCSSDTDAESISATSYQGTSSPESFHSLCGQFHTSVDEISSLRKDSCKDIHPPAETSLEVKEGKSKFINASLEKKSSSSLSMMKTEKMGWFITEEAMDRRNCKNPPYIYLMNMIIGFILLVAVIGNIMSILLSVKI